jgi:hypothetical protein
MIKYGYKNKNKSHNVYQKIISNFNKENELSFRRR